VNAPRFSFGMTLCLLALPGCGAGISDPDNPAPAASVPASMDFSTCPWPVKGLADKATVRLRVLVGPNGAVHGVELVSSDPEEQGFGERAEECARQKTFKPAVLADGSPTQAWTPVFRVQFAR